MCTKFFLWASAILAILCANIFAETPAPMVVVTCATSELGRSIAKTLAAGYSLLLTGRDLDQLMQIQQECQAVSPGLIEICSLDFSHPASLVDFEKRIQQRNQPISGLVLITPRPAFQNLFQGEAEWLALFQRTFTGPLEALKAVRPHLDSRGKIVILAGATSVQFMPEYGPACVVRRMWVAYSKALSHELGPKGIHVNALSPGVVRTPFHEERIMQQAEKNGCTFEEQLQKGVADIPLRRHASPAEIAQAIKFLLSDEANFITGINLLMDGGRSLSY